MMLGRSYYWPIYEAAVKHDLPIGLHAGSMYRYAPTSGGWPSHYLHDYVANSQMFEDQLLSLISNGVFNRFPSLRVVLIESGVTWLPGFIWRAIKTWRGVRAEVPWVKRSPAETIRENVRLTVQPIDAPRDTPVIDRIIEQIDSDRMLLFASDYPHWQFDGDAVLPGGLSADLLTAHSHRQSVGNLSSPEGERAMNAPVDVLERRADTDARLGIVDCDIHPYMKPGALEPVPVGALAQTRCRIRQIQLRHLCRPRHLSALFTQHIAPRCLAAGWWIARLRRAVPARATAGRLQHRLRRSGTAARRQHVTQSRRSRRALHRDERLAGA